MRNKECTKCNIEKKISEFSKNRSDCKECNRKACKDYKRNNRDKISAYNKVYKATNSESISEYNSAYDKKNRAEIQFRQTRQHAERKKVDPQFKLAGTLRIRIAGLVKLKGVRKANKTLDLLGCSLDFFKNWLETLFVGDMTFDNHGKVWHIDHVIPCAKFNIEKSEEQHRCFNWTNMKPMYARDNISKNDQLTLKELHLHEIRLGAFLAKNKEAQIIKYDKLQYLD